MIKLRPLHDKVTVLRDPPKSTSEGGIELTEDIDSHSIGTVLEVGPQTVSGLKASDRVVYGKFTGADLTVDGKNICILRDASEYSDVIGVLEEVVELTNE